MGVVVLNYTYYISRDTVKPSMIAIRNEILGVNQKKTYVFGERDINGHVQKD